MKLSRQNLLASLRLLTLRYVTGNLDAPIWKSKFGGMDVSDAKRLKSLEDEREAEEAARRDDARQCDPQGHQQPEVVTPVAKRQVVAHVCTGARGERAPGVPSLRC